MKAGRLAHNLRFVVQPRRKPRLLLRTVRSVLAHRLGRGPLRNVDVALDYGCNLACVHCSCTALRQPDEARRLELDDYRRLGEELLALGTLYVSFTGGEPMRSQARLEEVLGAFPTDRMLIGLQTNALLLDADRAARYHDLGVDVLQVSLDGFDAAQHDAMRRREGAHTATLRAVDLALDAGLRVILCTSVTPEGVHSEDLVRLLEFTEERGLPMVVSIPCPSGKWNGNRDILLGPAERRRLDDLLERFPGFRRDFHSNYSRLGCSAGTEKLYVTPFGDVIPCPFIHVSFGNVREEPVSVIRRRMLGYERFNEYAPHCLAGEDDEFLDEVMGPTFRTDQLPVPLAEHPALERLLRDVPVVERED